MPLDEVLREGERVMTVCNACRYCEGYCPVFPAMEQQVAFARGDLTYLANLCHNCGECLYACQYAAPHEFAINVPATLARIRLRSYEEVQLAEGRGSGVPPSRRRDDPRRDRPAHRRPRRAGDAVWRRPALGREP